MNDLGFTHVYLPGNADKPTLLLLHGTGGDEHDLMDLGRNVAPDLSILSVRGKVLENGMPRFFRRHAEGVFDLEDLKFRTNELTDFITAAKDHYKLKRIVALGYSNGANIAANILLTHPNILDAAVLLRAMFPDTPETQPDLKGKDILILSGLFDQIIPREQTVKLANLFEQAGARVTLNQKPTGHGLIQSDIDDAREFLKKF